MNYTKGKWQRYNAPNGEHIWCENEHIADFDGKNANANAKLCTAAPDLYEALRTILPLITTEWNGPIQEIARQALAKAEGK